MTKKSKWLREWEPDETIDSSSDDEPKELSEQMDEKEQELAIKKVKEKGRRVVFNPDELELQLKLL